MGTQQLELEPTRQQVFESKERLRGNPYPGRIALMGLSEDGKFIIIGYALGGRSDPSKDRDMVQDPFDGSIRTVAPRKTAEEMADTQDADLIYYRAMRSTKNGLHVVSNGAQTDHVLRAMIAGAPLEGAVRSAPIVPKMSGGEIDLSWYEPDPNTTPRITGAIDLALDARTPFGLTVVRRNLVTDRPIYSTYEAPSIASLKPGVAYGVHTYNGLGDPLPSFDQDPFMFPLSGSLPNIANDLVDTINPDTFVALAVRRISLETQQVSGTVLVNDQF